MKISENTPDRLILDDVPWIRGILIILVTLYVIAMGFHEWNDGRTLGPWIVGGGVLAGLLFFALFVERYQIIFLRSEKTILRRKRSVFGFSETRHDLGAVSHAEVEEETGTDNDVSYYAALIVPEGPDAPKLRLTDYSTSGFGPPALVDQINDWLGVDG